MNKTIQFFMFFFFIILISSSLSPSLPAKTFNLFFPEVTVELRNNATHGVHVKCGYEKLNELNNADTMKWRFREILYPLKWCYARIDEDKEGVFWASHVRSQCSYCYWSIRDDGVYFYRENLRRWDKQRLLSGPIRDQVI